MTDREPLNTQPPEDKEKMKAAEETYLTQVETCYGERQHERVLEIIEEMKDRGMTSNGVALYVMNVLRVMNRYDEAEKIGEQIIERESDNLEVCAKAYYNLASLELDADHLDQALELAKKSCDMSSDRSDRYSIARIYRRKSDYEKAMDVYSSMLRQDPMDELVHLDIADMYRSDMGDSNRAVRYYRKILEMNPEYTYIRNMLSCLLIIDGKYEEALEEIDVVIDQRRRELNSCEKLNDGYIAALKEVMGKELCDKSDILQKLHCDDEAIAVLEQALEISPTDAHPLTKMAVIHRKRSDDQGVIDCFERIIQGGQGNEDSYIQLSKCLRKLNKHQRREEILNEGIEKFGQSCSLYWERAAMWREGGQYGKMSEDYEMYVRLADYSVSAYLEVGRNHPFKSYEAYDKELSFYDCFKYDAYLDEVSILWYKKGIGVHPNDWCLWHELGQAYVSRGHGQEAIDCLEKALSLLGAETKRQKGYCVS